MEISVKEFLQAYSNAILEGNAAVFAGAGLSIPAGFVDWRNLMRPIAEDLGLDVDKENDLIALAQYHKNERGGRHKINQLIRGLLKSAAITENHKVLASLPIDTYWTTNYDNLIEKSLEQSGKLPDVKLTVGNLSDNVKRRDAVVYKMHGDASLPHEAVVTKDDYEAYNSKRLLFSTALQGDLVSKTFLFIGFSFSDPNLDYVLARIRILLGENRRDHYCLMRRVQQSDFSSRDEYVYAKTKQELQIRDLNRYGILCVLVDSYHEITEVLQSIARRYKISRIFVSGSASTYDPWPLEEAQDFIYRLGFNIVSNGFTLITGFGLGVGTSLINGALDYLSTIPSHRFDDKLILRPFPRHGPDSKARRELWRKYRENMISEAGIAVHIFGNKSLHDGSIGDADGMREELKIATDLGLKIVPIGATGYVSRDLWKEVLENFETFYGPRSGLKTRFRKLGNTRASYSVLLASLMDFLNKLEGAA
jgi:hypothetical protein